MKQIRTTDNSYTIYSEKYNEEYHCKICALEEAFKKFVEPLNLKPGVRLLDIGFGIGYTAGAAIQTAHKIKIISLENDPEILKEVQNIKVPYWFTGTYSIIQKAAANLFYKDESVEIKIILGNAQETIKTLPADKESRFDAVILDPFSPPKNPELWTKEFLQEVYNRMEKRAVLTTFSCAAMVRKNLSELGFEVKDGPTVGRRTPSTIAVKNS